MQELEALKAAVPGFMRRKGRSGSRISALEAACEGYRLWSCRIACSRGRELILEDRPRVRPGGSVE